MSPSIGRAQRVVIVEDERGMRELLLLAFEREGYAVRALSNGIGLAELVRDWPADIVVLDIMLPGSDGVTLLERVRTLSDVPVLMLTALGETSSKVRALGLGADDYVTKPFEVDELLARVAAALRRPNLAAGNVLRFADVVVDLDARSVQRAGRQIDLTPREFSLLEVLSRTPGRAYSKDELLERVWGYDYEGSGGIVDRYISYVRAKLEDAGGERIVHTVRGIGYALRRDAH